MLPTPRRLGELVPIRPGSLTNSMLLFVGNFAQCSFFYDFADHFPKYCWNGEIIREKKMLVNITPSVNFMASNEGFNYHTVPKFERNTTSDKVK